MNFAKYIKISMMAMIMNMAPQEHGLLKHQEKRKHNKAQ